MEHICLVSWSVGSTGDYNFTFILSSPNDKREHVRLNLSGRVLFSLSRLSFEHSEREH